MDKNEPPPIHLSPPLPVAIARARERDRQIETHTQRERERAMVVPISFMVSSPLIQKCGRGPRRPSPRPRPLSIRPVRRSASALSSPLQPLGDGDSDSDRSGVLTSRDSSLPRSAGPLASEDRLMGPTGEGLKVAYQALAQCEQTLDKFGIEHRKAVDGTADAAKFIAEQKLQDTGAVASSLAAQLYGLNILEENIQDDAENITRFMMLAREPIFPRTDKPFKTSIVFSLEQGPRQLFKALEVFAMQKINLTKMESRPHKKRSLRVAGDNCSAPLKHFDYLFYADLEASVADPNAQNALGNLKEFATFLRVLGSYPTYASES